MLQVSIISTEAGCSKMNFEPSDQKYDHENALACQERPWGNFYTPGRADHPAIRINQAGANNSSRMEFSIALGRIASSASATSGW
jgi:hypothetical protein